MAKKGTKASKKNNIASGGSDLISFNSSSSSTASNGLKKSKKLSKGSVSMDSLHGSTFSEKSVGFGEKRKSEFSEENAKKKKKKKKMSQSDIDMSDYSEKGTKTSDSGLKSTKKSGIKPSKRIRDHGNESPSKIMSPKSKEVGSLQNISESPLKMENVLGSPKVRSPKKTVTKMTSPSKIQSFSDKSIKKSPGKHSIYDISDQSINEVLSDSEEQFQDYDVRTEDEEIPTKESASTSPKKVKGKCDDWSEEQTEQLIDIMTVDLKVKPEDRSSFRQRLKKISWGNIPEKLDPPRTAEECAQHLEDIFKKINTIRNLSEMFIAHKVGVQNRSKYYVRLPIQRFRAENSEAIKKRGGNYFATSKIMFDELSENEKFERYILPYQKELMVKHLKNPKKKISYTHAAWHFYRERHPNLDVKDAKQRYSKLTPKKRLPYIRRSYEEFKNVWRAREEMDSPVDGKIKAPFCHLSKEDWVILLKSMEMPVMEAKSPRELFMKMNPETEELNTSKSYFTNHPDHEKYHSLFAEMRDDFKTKFEEWMHGVEDDILKKPAAAYYEEVMNIKINRVKNKTTNSVSKVTSKVRELEESFVESGIVGNFPGEPKAPLMTAKDIFAGYMKKATPGMKIKEINEQFSAIADGFSEKLTNLACKAANEYKEQVKQFVAELPTAEKKIYIGQNRIKFVKMFQGEDIFEEDYPCSEYPPFKKPTKVVDPNRKSANSSITTLYDYWTPKRKEGQLTSGKSKLSASTPMCAETPPASSQSGQAVSDETGTDEESSESISDESSAAEETVSGASANGSAKASPRVKTSTRTQSKQHVEKSETESSSDEESDDDEGEFNQNSQFLKSKVHHAEPRGSSDDESEEDLAPAWSQKRY